VPGTLRILYVTSADFERTDAPTVRTKGLATALAAEGCRVEVIGIKGEPFEKPFRYRPIAYPSLRHWGQVAYQFELALRRVDCRRFDRILLRETPFCFQPYLWGRPVYLEVNGLALEELLDTRGPRRAVAESLYRWGYRRARAILALTPAIQQYLIEHAGAPLERVHVVSNAVELDRLYPEDRDSSRRVLGLPEQARTVFYVGSYHRQHGLDLVADAARRTDALFVMAGQGDEDFRRRVTVEGLSEKFRFLGRIDDDTLRRAIGAADLCLNPASERTAALTNATFPQKVLEYLACGRPVISMGDAPAIRQVLDGCGRVVPATAAGLADGLRAALADPAALRAQGQRGRALVMERYSYRQVVQQYLAVLR
jgi:glycosyltransferase involved in cell wall biosynthesis